jgi:hypothetical protein
VNWRFGGSFSAVAAALLTLFFFLGLILNTEAWEKNIPPKRRMLAL